MSHLPARVLSVLRHRPKEPSAHPPSRALTQQWRYQPAPEGLVPPARRVPIPGTDKVQLEARRDCLRCGGERNALVRANGFQCLHCQVVTITA